MTNSIDVYISEFPHEVQDRLRRLRALIRESVPHPSEMIGYAIMSVSSEGEPLLYYGAWKNYIGLYPVPALRRELEARVAPYRHTVDALKFPHCDEFPLVLIAEVIGELVARRQRSAIAV